jgi:osmotically-inducible protein OsmY
MAKGTAYRSGRTSLEDARAEATKPTAARPKGPRRKRPAAAADDAAGADVPAELPSSSRARELDEGLGYGREDGPESQGGYAGTGYGDDRQGSYGDEDYDASYGPTGMAGPQPIDAGDRGADTPSQEPWDAISEESDDIVANDERDVATGEAALQPVKKRSRASASRPDDRIRDDIEDLIFEELVDADDVTVLVVDGAVALEGVVETVEQRDAVESCAEGVAGVREIDNRLEVRTDPDSEA